MHAILGDFEWEDERMLEFEVYDEPEEETDNDFEKEEWKGDDKLSTQTRLWMPSTFGHNFCLKNSWGHIAEQEIQLQIVQAEESLDELRLAIGHKSLLYKLRIQKSKT